jgi:predicted TIM-barrel fold metal-dependent hydrolase
MVMGSREISIIDCDGHVMESIEELADFMDPGDRQIARFPRRNREGVFPSLAGIFHLRQEDREAVTHRARVTASTHRTGSGEDWLAFIDQVGIEQAVLYPTEGLSVGNVQLLDYEIRLCRAYNDYMAERFRKVSPRLHPNGLLPMHDVNAAVIELRRAVKELGLTGVMLPSTGLPLDLGHDYYWPIYQEAADLGCVLGIHGGGNKGIGIDSFKVFNASHVLHHPLPLMIAMVSMVCHGVFDRYPALRVAFLEGGCGWLVCLLDRMKRNEEYYASGAQRTLPAYLASGQILIGCEGEDESLPYLVQRVGPEAFAYSSDYPHEVDLLDAQRQIERTQEHPELSDDDKAAILGSNSRRFFRL